MNTNDLSKRFYSIKEYSEITDISTTTLRFYDNTDVFSPAAHGEGRQKNYRLYSSEQITTVNMVRVLSEMGFSLDEIADLGKARTPETMMKQFARRERIIANEMRKLQWSESGSCMHRPWSAK